jgi:hypothetical protein
MTKIMFNKFSITSITKHNTIRQKNYENELELVYNLARCCSILKYLFT